jgi:hypothetical protein
VELRNELKRHWERENLLQQRKPNLLDVSILDNTTWASSDLEDDHLLILIPLTHEGNDNLLYETGLHDTRIDYPGQFDDTQNPGRNQNLRRRDQPLFTSQFWKRTIRATANDPSGEPIKKTPLSVPIKLFFSQVRNPALLS